MVTRRALLGAGVLLVAGCGPPDAPEIVPKDVLEQQLRVAVTAAQALNNTQLRDSSDARVLRIAAAYEDLGGDWEAVANAAPEGRDALTAVRAELAAHVQAVGQLGEPEYRELFAEVIASAAADEAALAPPYELTPFPGTP
jgi:uncharacterized membrane protein